MKTSSPILPSSRIKISNRESSAYIVLRRKGLSLTTISKAFGRSLSVVHKRISRNKRYESSKFRFLDKRKFPPRIRLFLLPLFDLLPLFFGEMVKLE